MVIGHSVSQLLVASCARATNAEGSSGIEERRPLGPDVGGAAQWGSRVLLMGYVSLFSVVTLAVLLYSFGEKLILITGYVDSCRYRRFV